MVNYDAQIFNWIDFCQNMIVHYNIHTTIIYGF